MNQNEIKDLLIFLINNQVILPVVISLAVTFVSLKKAAVVEEDENFIRLKEQYRGLWALLANDTQSLKKGIDQVPETQKLHAFQVVEFFYMVWFLNFKKNSRYRDQWEENMRHIFSHKLIRTTFFKHARIFDPEYQQFVKEHLKLER